MDFKIKPRDVMGDNIALHWLVNDGLDIPTGEVWVREDWARNIIKFIHIIIHESLEIYYMKMGKPYEEAHRLSLETEGELYRELLNIIGGFVKDLSAGDSYSGGDIMDWVRQYNAAADKKKKLKTNKQIDIGSGLNSADFDGYYRATGNTDRVRGKPIVEFKYRWLKRGKKKKPPVVPPSSQVTGLEYW